MANTGTPAAARGWVSAAMMPVSAKSSGPWTQRARQAAPTVAPAGAPATGQTIDSSSAVRVTE
jgi:hypothetical protein